MRFFQFRKPDPDKPENEPLEDDEKLVKKDFLRKLKRVAAKITFSEKLLAAYFCAMDTSTPVRVKAILMAALAYFVVPADLIPDFLVGLGYTDDISVLIAAITSVNAHVKEEHMEKARDLLETLD
ncbi:YkvA family protein [Kiloniella sp.]|uniref:YkvA family protein n=1 Tax=Kiloniella sp. TaxID=1938587 RepID=UPI003B01FF95